MRINTPQGTKEICITEPNSETTILISDMERGNRSFSLTVKVQGENAKIFIIGRTEGKQSDIKKWDISLELEGENQEGVLDLKGVVDDSSLLEFDGGGVLKNTSSQGDIEVVEKIFLFSQNSRAKAIPVLRVETEDVSAASHSASIAPFSQELFFYLESRGIDKTEGKELMKAGILNIADED